MAHDKNAGPVGTAPGGKHDPDLPIHGTRGGEDLTAGGGTGGQPPGDANNSNPDTGYRHWHDLGSMKPPGYMIPERKAPDSGGGLSEKRAGGERPPKHDPAPGKMDPMRMVGKQVKPIGS
jgi:hypothetical protein